MPRRPTRLRTKVLLALGATAVALGLGEVVARLQPPPAKGGGTIFAPGGRRVPLGEIIHYMTRMQEFHASINSEVAGPHGYQQRHLKLRLGFENPPPRWDYFEVRRAGLALARELERRTDGLATTEWWKEERSGVFIDYNQNARDKTIASAYSIRQTGLVSAPFAWKELSDIQTSKMTIPAFHERYQALGDLTEGIDETAGTIKSVMEMVATDEERGLGDAPWPPHYPKMPGEPPRVQPSKRKMQG